MGTNAGKNVGRSVKGPKGSMAQRASHSKSVSGKKTVSADMPKKGKQLPQSQGM